MKAYRIIITGRVQGVFFRQSTRERALELGINGTVRNCKDGSVEVFVEGIPEKIEQLIDWCRRGPKNARVDKIDINEDTLKNYIGFRITH